MLSSEIGQHVVQAFHPADENIEEALVRRGAGVINSRAPVACRKDDRPVPFSYTCKCNEKGKFVGLDVKMRTKANDQLHGYYEPCCVALTDKQKKLLHKYLITGFPSNADEAKKYGIEKGKNILGQYVNDVKSAAIGDGRAFIGLKD